MCLRWVGGEEWVDDGDVGIGAGADDGAVIVVCCMKGRWVHTILSRHPDVLIFLVSGLFAVLCCPRPLSRAVCSSCDCDPKP
jgi:hypothetical protein